MKSNFNSKMTKTMLISTSQIVRVHFLGNFEPGLKIAGTPLKGNYLDVAKLLGVHIDSYFNGNFI